jgi:hypothetical protein
MNEVRDLLNLTGRVAVLTVPPAAWRWRHRNGSPRTARG